MANFVPYLDNIPTSLLARAAKIRLAAFDVDGTLTDGRLYYHANGDETKVFHAHDGLGLKRLRTHGVEVALITARSSHATAVRAQELNIPHVYQAQPDKRHCLMQLLEKLNLTLEQVAFTGDDLSDLAVMRSVGLAVAVANAHPWIAQVAHWKTLLQGGMGAAREVTDLILHAQHKSVAEQTHWQ